MHSLIAQIEMDGAAVEVGRNFLDKLSEFFQKVGDAGLIPTIFMGIIFSAALIGSAAMASSIAEGRLRSRNLHFLLGLVVPVLYPLAALAILPKRRNEKPDEKEFAMSNYGSAGEDEVSAEEESLFSHYQGLMHDDHGNLRGPFMMRIDDDVELRVERIMDVQENVIVVETQNADGNLQTMRFPFDRITTCREI